MARTTRATRQQRDVDGTDVSPLVSLDDHPRRQKAAIEIDAQKDSSKTSKRASQAEDTMEAPVKAKHSSKKVAQEEVVGERPAKAKQTSKKATQEESVEEAAVRVKATSKHTREVETAESSPAKAKHSTKKRQETDSADKSPVKAKRAKKTHQEDPTEQEHANTKKPRAKKTASGDKTTKSARAESPVKDTPANARTAHRDASAEPIGVIQTSPTKAKRARARSPAKSATANHKDTASAASHEPTAENPTSPVKAALARAGNPVDENELGTAENPTSPVKAALARAGSPVEPNKLGTADNPMIPVKAAIARAESPIEDAELGAADNPTSPVKAALARAGDLAEEDEVDTAENPTSPVKAALARAGSPVAADERPTAGNSTSPTKSVRTRARSPAKPSPSKQLASPPHQKDTVVKAQTKSTRSDTFLFALSSSPLPRLTNSVSSPSLLCHVGASAESALEASPCPGEESLGSDEANGILDGTASTRSSSGRFLAENVSDRFETATSRVFQAQSARSALTTLGSAVSSIPPRLAYQNSTPLQYGGRNVLGTLSTKEKSLVSASDSPTVLSHFERGRLPSAAAVKPHATEVSKGERGAQQRRSFPRLNAYSRVTSRSKEFQTPVITGRLQRQLNREAMVFVKFWIDPAAFASDRERDLQGTYCMPKTSFLHFFLALRPEEKVLTETVSPRPQISAKPTSKHTSPRKVSSNDSTPTKRKLHLPESDDDQPTPTKRLRTEAKPRTSQQRSPAKTNGVRVSAKSPVKQKRYAKQGGYDKNGNLVLPGQELLESTTDEELTKAPPVMLSGLSPLAMFQQSSKAQNSGPRSPTKLSRAQRDVNGIYSPSMPTAAPKEDLSPPLNNFNTPATPERATQPSFTPATAPNPRTPGRRWNLAGRVTASIGKLNPFSFFARPLQNSESPSAPLPEPHVVVEPSIEHVAEPVFVRVDEPSNTRMELLPAHEVMESPSATSNTQQALVLAESPDPQTEVSELLLSVLQLRCPDIADERLVSTVQASFNQSEGLARHKAEEAQRRLDSVTDPVTKRLLVLLERQYPDLSSIGILAKLDELIDQQQIVADFRQEQARKHQIAATEASVAKKRKRPSSPEVIPNPVGKSYGMDLDFFGSDSDSDEEMLEEEAEPERPSKMPRLDKGTPPSRHAPARRQPGTEPVPAAKKNAHVRFQSNSAVKPKDDPKRASLYTGSIFRDSYDATGNIFAAAGHQDSTTTDKSAGRFEVPMSSSDSEDSDDELPATPSKAGPPSQNKSTLGGGSILKGSPLNAAAKAAKEAATKEPTSKESPAQAEAAEPSKDSDAAPSPPPAPTPAHAALPAAPSSQGQHDPVALARAQANKYAPKTSSKLKSVSRLSNSPAMKKASANLLLDGEKNGVKRNANIKFVNLMDDYELEPAVREVFEHWDHKHAMNFVAYELEPNVSDAFAAWDNLEIDPTTTYELDPEVGALLSNIEYD